MPSGAKRAESEGAVRAVQAAVGELDADEGVRFEGLRGSRANGLAGAGLRERYGKMHAEEQRARGLEEVATAFVGNHARLPAARLMAARMRG